MTDDNPRILEHIHHSLTYTVYDTKWIPKSARFVSLGSYPRQSGVIDVYCLKEGNKVEKIVEMEKKHAIKCGTFDSSALEERYLAYGDFVGNVALVDLEKKAKEVWSAPQAHEGIINAIDGCGTQLGCPEVATAGRDGCVRIWDTRQKYKEVASLMPAYGEKTVDCWAVAFGHSYTDYDRMVACGYENGDLKIFDLRTNTVNYETNLKNGICSIQFDNKYKNKNLLLVSHLEGRFSLLDLLTQHPEKGYATLTEKVNPKASSTVWCGSFLPQNPRLFMVGTGAGTLQLYKYKFPEERSIGSETKEGVIGKVLQLSKQTVSTQPICSFDWNRDKEGLAVTGAFDQALRVIVVTKLDKY